MGLIKLLFGGLINNIKGALFEGSVKRVFPKDGQFNKTYSNFTFYNENGDSVQIDLIYLCGDKIYVIEAKNYSGLIYGSSEQQYWKQVLMYGKVKNDFYNPLKQNKSHIYYLKSYLEKYDINCKYESVVVFGSNAKLNISDIDLYSYGLFKRYIKKHVKVESFDNHQRIRLILDKMSQIKINKKEHINSIEERQSKIKYNICPRCGGNLVLKEGKYGTFIGCSNFPKCKFVKK